VSTIEPKASVGTASCQSIRCPQSTTIGRNPTAVSTSSGPSEHPITLTKVRLRQTSRQRKHIPSAIDVARYLVYLAACESEPEFLTHLRLQKLLYYVQGWSLALRGRAMFSERIEAWAHGPVVPSVYPKFAEYGDKPISPENMLVSQVLSKDDRELIESVWESYKVYSSSSLRTMTHSEAPWKDARGKAGTADRCTAEITKDAMKRFFVEASGRHGQK
jgi:uncharacterized phage-associated protein